MREAARRAGIELILPTIEAPYWREEEYRAAFTRIAEESVDGIVVATMVENWTYRRLFITLAKRGRLRDARSGLTQQLRQLGDVGGDAPGLVAGEQLGRRTPSRLILEMDVGQRLPAVVPDDEASAYCDSSIIK
jgi:hypothetical protein